MRKHPMGEVIYAFYVGIEHIVPHFLGYIREKCLLGNGCVVYQHINAAEMPENRLGSVMCFLAAGYVAPEYFAACFGFKAESRFLAFVIYSGDIVACLRKQPCTFPADASLSAS